MKLKIILDDPDHRYTGGEFVKGKVIVESDTETKASGLLLVCAGRGNVRWTYHRRQPMNGKATKQTLVATDRETYFEQKLFLKGSERGPSFKIPPLHTEFPFSVELPHGIPSSYYTYTHLHYGKVEYYLDACIIRSWKINVRERIIFLVNGALDLNTRPEAIEPPVDIQTEKRLCCWCCRSGPVGFIFKTNKLGYVPGEKLEFAVDLYNKSSRDVHLVNARFLQHHTLRAMGGQKYHHSHVIEEKIGQPLRAGQNLFWQDYFMIENNPPIPPTDLGGRCKLIKIWYNVKIEMHSKCALPLEGGARIIIGTIPITSEEDSEEQGDVGSRYN